MSWRCLPGPPGGGKAEAVVARKRAAVAAAAVKVDLTMFEVVVVKMRSVGVKAGVEDGGGK